MENRNIHLLNWAKELNKKNWEPFFPSFRARSNLIKTSVSVDNGVVSYSGGIC